MKRLAIVITNAAFAAFALLALASSAVAAPPTIVRVTVSEVSAVSATLLGEINPGGQETFYRFEYGLKDCSKSACTKVPASNGSIPPGSSPVPVSFPIAGLAPGTTYHLRLVAENVNGEIKSPDRIFATYVPAFEGIPDGREYEQASPVKKNAADARGTVAWVRAAEDGGAVSFLSSSGIPGGVGGQELPAFLASRGASDWSTQGLLPPATFGDLALVLGWLPDLSAVFSFATDFGVDENKSPVAKDGVFLSRKSADGSLTEIVKKGEGLGLPSYAGASADGSKVIFEGGAKLPCCPGAAAGSKVYLWERDSGEISLASVLNVGQSPPQGASAGPYDWMRTETPPLKGAAAGGGSAGSYYTADMNAISADGSAVFFTAAGSGILYMRVNPTAAQSPLDGEGKCINPALACTVEVSASQRTSPDPLGQRPAAFMGATPDGATAFFTSPEELTDEANTGPVQPPPAIDSADVSAESPVSRPSLPITATGIAIDATHVYWVNPQANAIGRAELDGDPEDPTFVEIPPREECPHDQEGCPAEDEEMVPANPQYVAVDSEHIYWTNERSGNKLRGTIGRADIDGNEASIEANWIEGTTRPRGIAVNATHVFWAKAGAGSSGEGSIGRAEIDGDPVEHEFIEAIALEMPEGVALDASHVYWTSNNENAPPPADTVGGLRRADLVDGENEEGKRIGTDVELRGMAVDADHAYWASQSQGEEAIGRMPLADFPVSGECDDIPTKCKKEFIPTSGTPKGLALSATDLYWSVNGEVTPNPGNDLYRYRAADGSLLDLAPDASHPNGAEVKGVLGASEDGKRVYFAANGDLDGPGEAKAGDCKGSVDFNGRCSLYLAEEASPDDWSITFVAPLDASGQCEPDTSNLTSDATNWLGKASSCRTQKSAMTSTDGSVLLFRSKEQLTAYDNEGHSELYRYEVGEGLACVSCNPTGEAPIGAAKLGSIGLSTFEPQPGLAAVQMRNLSADGDQVFFETGDPLVIDDTNGEDGCATEGGTGTGFLFPSCQDAYEWEAEGTGSCEEDVQGGGCLYLLSTGTSPHASFFADASESGEDAFIATRSPGLVGQDQDELQDIFDLRIGGGLASQNQPPVPDCESLDGCRPPATPPPSSQSPASASFSGPGNRKQARKPARKHRQKKRGQKKRRHKSKQAAHRGARSDR